MDIFGRSLFCTPEGYQTYRDVHTLITAPTREGGCPGGSDSKKSVRNAGDLGLTPGLGRSLEEGA